MIEITLDHIKPRDEERQTAYITVSGVDSQVYRFQVGNVPATLTTNQQIQDHLDGRKDELHLFCLKKTWSDADPWDFKDPEKSELQNFLDWIDAGHKNKVIMGYEDEEKTEPIYDYVEITNHIYAGTHPLRYPPAEDVLQEALTILAPFSDQTFAELEARVNSGIPFIKEISAALLALIRFVDHNAN